ncbi:MAG TPA: hypothetical protein VFK45_11340 [Gammaproteobacteria bacterium]|nr:hypothetical protein [Gammaproteobacteria bacterium]
MAVISAANEIREGRQHGRFRVIVMTAFALLTAAQVSLLSKPSVVAIVFSLLGVALGIAGLVMVFWKAPLRAGWYDDMDWAFYGRIIGGILAVGAPWAIGARFGQDILAAMRPYDVTLFVLTLLLAAAGIVTTLSNRLLAQKKGRALRRALGWGLAIAWGAFCMGLVVHVDHLWRVVVNASALLLMAAGVLGLARTREFLLSHR